MCFCVDCWVATFVLVLGSPQMHRSYRIRHPTDTGLPFPCWASSSPLAEQLTSLVYVLAFGCCIVVYVSRMYHVLYTVYIYIYIYTCIWTQSMPDLQINIHTIEYIYIYIHILACIHIHTYIHACMHACMHTCMHAYIHTYIHTYIHACIHTYIHTRICTHMMCLII